jgi:hypothetical protein
LKDELLSELFGLLELLWTGFTLIGQAITGLIKAFLLAIGVPVEDWMIQIAVIILLLITIWKYGKHAPRLLLAVLLIILASIILGAFFG